MLEIEIPPRELWNEQKEEFIYVKGAKLRLEHSLLSISKWESKWKKRYLDEKNKLTYEESIDYVRCMTMNQNVDLEVYYGIDEKTMSQINEYINDNRSATTFTKRSDEKPGRERISSELIYYWMVSYNIPFECEKWHLSRLMTLIRICNVKQEKPPKVPKATAAASRASLNAARRRSLNSKG